MNTTDPFDAPLINPNLLGTDVDLAIMRAAISAARAFVSTPAFVDYITGEFGAFAEAQTDDEINAYARDNADTVDHPVGTVALGTALDPDLCVKGTQGLRVVDASVFVSANLGFRSTRRVAHDRGSPQPFIPSGHTQGPTYIVAERAASLVRAKLKK